MTEMVAIQQIFYDMFVTYSLGTPALAAAVIVFAIVAIMKLNGFGMDSIIIVMILASLIFGAIAFGNILSAIIAIIGAIVIYIMISKFFRS